MSEPKGVTLEDLRHLLENVNRAGPFVGKAEQRLQVAIRKALPALLDRLEQAERVVAAATKRITKGHNDTCGSLLIEGLECDCGQQELTEALADYDRAGEKP